MAVAIHPLRLLARTDADVSEVYHSFFFAEYIGGQMTLVHKVPTFRKKKVDEDLEIGVQFFITEFASKPFITDTFGQFVVTSSVGTKYNVFWRSLESRMFIAVTSFYLLTFTRELFSLLPSIPAADLYVTLLSLCETPMLPISGVQYNINFQRVLKGSSASELVDSAFIKPIKFSNVEQVCDWSINAVALSVFNAKMLVSAWEAILLERKVLVASTNAALIAPCCEFLRRLVLPLMVINTYVPYLTPLIINTLDSPLPYLVGADTNDVLNSFIDLSETVVVDLDAQEVLQPSTAFSEASAPPLMVSKLVKDLNAILLGRWSTWMTSSDSLNLQGQRTAPLAPATITDIADQVIQLFVDCNLSILSARALDDGIPTFFRKTCDYVVEMDDTAVSREISRESRFRSTSDAFTAQFGVSPCITCRKFPRILQDDVGFTVRQDAAHGIMQLIRKRHSDDVYLHFLPCWVEMDDVTFCVYEQADETPFICCSVKDVYAVSPSSAEPEGLVFEIALNANKTLMFAADNAKARRSWMGFIEQKMRRNMTSTSLLSSPTDVPLGSPSTRRPTNPSVDVSFGIQGAQSAIFTRTEEQQNSLKLGLFGLRLNKLTELEEGEAKSKYRFAVRKTQMYSYLHSLIEPGEYEDIFRKQKIAADELAANSLQLSIENYLWEGTSVQALLTKISSEVQTEKPEDDDLSELSEGSSLPEADNLKETKKEDRPSDADTGEQRTSAFMGDSNMNSAFEEVNNSCDGPFKQGCKSPSSSSTASLSTSGKGKISSESGHNVSGKSKNLFSSIKNFFGVRIAVAVELSSFPCIMNAFTFSMESRPCHGRRTTITLPARRGCRPRKRSWMKYTSQN
jgi:hypothetical protein